MARKTLTTPWPQITTRVPLKDRMSAREALLGHPSAPGLRAAVKPRQGGPSPGNGQPGVPVLVPGRYGTPGFPGQTSSGPTQPGTDYRGEHDF